MLFLILLQISGAIVKRRWLIWGLPRQFHNLRTERKGHQYTTHNVILRSEH